MKFVLIFALIGSVSHTFAHGGGKPGPHGGHIKMPGSFHTELIIENNIAKIYLLDINFKNPITLDSKVLLVASNKSKKEEVSCLAKVSYFECPILEKISNYSQILIKASRYGKTGTEVSYTLPLTFPTSVHH